MSNNEDASELPHYEGQRNFEQKNKRAFIWADWSKFEVEVQINRIIPTLCKLMGDPNSEVREAAANALVNIFWQLGEPVPSSIHKRHLIPEAKSVCSTYYLHLAIFIA
ncbi:unnamed protein product [Toxocara canis]|uniref:Importin N-terminal domain-containing protein n=1 Tax=Toxocara canis TaxID=6265 RepID=A0A183V7N9_TOXCA|nr:unnamed protein product [Toxocara canis]